MGAKSYFIIFFVTIIDLLVLASQMKSLHRWYFSGQLIVLVCLAAVSLLALYLISIDINWAYYLHLILFAVFALNLFVFYYLVGKSYSLAASLLLTALAGLVCIPGVKEKEQFPAPVEQKPVQAEIYDRSEASGSAARNKFVAGKTSRIYHIADCPAAKRIRASAGMPLDKDEIKKRGLKPHSCVK
ncbi:MAG: hypothetical protein ABH879_07105 [archaeon]